MSPVRKLSRKSDNRNHLYRNLATSLVLYEKIETTEAKSKDLKKIIDSLISTAKKNDLSARRAVLAYLFDKNAVDKMFEVIVPRYADISGGYASIHKLSYRKGDGALKCVIELLPPQSKESTAPEKKKVEDGK